MRQAQVFVAVLGASSYTFAEATWTQSLPDSTASHVRTFEFYGGCPELVIPDNLHSGVNRAYRYEPDFDDESAYLCFVRAVVDEERNRPAAARLAEERLYLPVAGGSHPGAHDVPVPGAQVEHYSHRQPDLLGSVAVDRSHGRGAPAPPVPTVPVVRLLCVHPRQRGTTDERSHAQG